MRQCLGDGRSFAAIVSSSMMVKAILLMLKFSLPGLKALTNFRLPWKKNRVQKSGNRCNSQDIDRSKNNHMHFSNMTHVAKAVANTFESTEFC